MTAVKLAISGALLVGAMAMPLAAQDASTPAQALSSMALSQTATQSSASEGARRMGQQIVRPAHDGLPSARFADPLCLKISGMPEDLAALVKTRIEENASQVGGIAISSEADCTPNAFVGVLNNVNQSVEALEVEQPWLFDGLLDYQVQRIYVGSEGVRAWHRFDRRNLDGTTLPGDRQLPEGRDQFFNRAEVATRFNQNRVDILGAVVLFETAATSGKSLRQIADYATIRLLASVTDDVTGEETGPATILGLFNQADAPAALTDFDLSYLQSLYELPANSSDGTVIAAAATRYEARRVAQPAS